MDLDKAIHELGVVRQEIAGRNRTLAERDLDARVLKAHLLIALRTGTRTADGKEWETPPVSSDTAAEKAALVHPDYLAFGRETARLTFERDLALADAESRVFAIKAALILDSRVAV